jgi:hypothetical protein
MSHFEREEDHVRVNENTALGIVRHVYKLDNFEAYTQKKGRFTQYTLEQKPHFTGRFILPTNKSNYFQLGVSDGWEEAIRRSNGNGIVWVAIDWVEKYKNYNLMGVRNSREEAVAVALTRTDLNQ